VKWITTSSSTPSTCIVLEPPAADPGVTDDKRRTIAEMMAKGSYAHLILRMPCSCRGRERTLDRLGELAKSAGPLWDERDGPAPDAS